MERSGVLALFFPTSPGMKNPRPPTSKPLPRPCGVARSRHRLAGRAFTLLELLVVIAILAVLGAIAVPAVSRSIQSSHQAKCVSNLRAIGAGMALFVAENNMRYPPHLLDKNAFPGFGDFPKWFGQLEPYIYRAISSKKTRSSVFLCPSDNRREVFCSYAMNPRASSFNHDSGKKLIPMSTLRGSPSKLIFAGDSNDSSTTINWQPGSTPRLQHAEYRHFGAKRDQNRKYASADEYHRQGGSANFLFFDGHVQSLKDEQLTEAMLRGN
jgi:prepilin-type N-terminal cleavage/methylation domain-containing protein/prepilin-type processing-associated H-X9-DG protein